MNALDNRGKPDFQDKIIIWKGKFSQYLSAEIRYQYNLINSFEIKLVIIPVSAWHIIKLY